MTLTQLARKLRPILEAAVQSLEDPIALEAVPLHPQWAAGSHWEAGMRLGYQGELYRVLQTHTAQADWLPTQTPSLYARVLLPNPEEPLPWQQPDSTNPYHSGDRVTHHGRLWVSMVGQNVWEPGVYGWAAVDVPDAI
ncbi:MAG TPA: hypothetical protein IAC31_03270 [Candidatus Faecousia intestinigallinarum]|nr:hypothetical protein [Candidatus Faecousia intestinigallinarum]